MSASKYEHIKKRLQNDFPYDSKEEIEVKYQSLLEAYLFLKRLYLDDLYDDYRAGFGGSLSGPEQVDFDKPNLED